GPICRDQELVVTGLKNFLTRIFTKYDSSDGRNVSTINVLPKRVVRGLSARALFQLANE
ncbi:hypothetical protein NPIL_164221, partial [Nephila pilipes]